MARPFRSLGGLLILGLFLNLLVTWCLALFSPPDATVVVASSRAVLPGDGTFLGRPYVQDVQVTHGPGQWHVHVFRSANASLVDEATRLAQEGSDDRFRVTVDEIVPRWAPTCLLKPDDSGVRPHLQQSFGPREQHAGAAAFGWPCAALRYERGGDRVQRAVADGGFSPPPRIDGGVALSSWPVRTRGADETTRIVRVLPWFPVWTGVVVNTLVLGCAIGVLLGGFRIVRGSRRGRRGAAAQA